MARYENFSDNSEDDDEEEVEQKSSNQSQKKASIFGASVLKTSETATNKKEPAKPEGLDRLLAELSFNKKEEPTQTEKVEATAPVEATEPQLPEVPVEFTPETTQQTQFESNEDLVLAANEELLSDSAEEADTAVVEADVETAPSEPEEDQEDEEDVASTATSTTSSHATSAGATTNPSTASVPVYTAPPAAVPAASSTTYATSTPVAAPPIYRPAVGPNTAPSAATSPAAANVAPNVQQQIDDAEFYARQKGRREGVLAGALLGGGIEHFRHKRRERKMEKEFAKTEKAHEKELENLTYEQKREAMVKDLRDAYEQRYQSRPEPNNYEAPARAEAVPAVPEAAKAEHAKTINPEEVIEVPKDHHIERSAWLSVEVDEQGNPVDKSSFEYGAEYYRERAHEIRADDGSDDQDETRVQGKNQPKRPMQDTMAPNSLGSFSSGYEDLGGPVQKPKAMPSQSTGSGSKVAKNVFYAVTTPPTTPAGTFAWSVALVVILIIIAVIVL